MLVNVYLDGALGKEFGKQWKLAITTPREALSIIQANTGRLMNWLRANAKRFANYKILVTYKNGKREYLGQDTYLTANNIKSVRFTPVIEGSGNVAKIVVGVVLMIASYWLGPYAFQAGLALAMNGVSGLLTPKQKTSSGNTNASHYFQGVGKNQMQGNPVPLIYGRCKIDAQTLSTRITVNEDTIVKDDATSGSKGFIHGSSN
ncbi:tail assembly protein [Acinetobacter brisouii]|uniref:tail assembly protein n=1 Tax=Acinetobacter brisouii TaxID=396323 RepID=UPI00124CAC3E|nr:tail assembly protein [Acinetobacter brisouii]